MSFRMSEGDWICDDPQCGNINFARRTACNRCKRERPELKAKKRKVGQEIGKSAAEKSRGLFSADDWQCSKCGNVNWARRQQCNVCNAPRFSDVEERTGVGGGYNERDVVEYKPRNDSDDEYDEVKWFFFEFGRRRKRKQAKKSDSISSDDRSTDIDKKKENKHSASVQKKHSDDEGGLCTDDDSNDVDEDAHNSSDNGSKIKSNEVDGDNTDGEYNEEEEEEEEEDGDDEDLSKYDLTDC